MREQVVRQAWDALKRNPMRSALTMMGVVWGVVSVTLLLAYGNGFRGALQGAFDAFGQSVVIAWPGQTSEQAGGERAGKRVRFEKEDVEMVRQEATLIKWVCRETVKWANISFQERMQNTAIRGVCHEYGAMRNEVAAQGRWLSREDEAERRRVCFLGGRVREKLFRGRPAVGEVVRIDGVRFTVVGVADRKIQLSNYFTSDDESVWIPYSTAGDLWDTRYAQVMVFAPVATPLEREAKRQFRAALAKRQRFSATDERAVQMFGREELRPIIEGLTVGLQALLTFIGVLTLGIGGVGVMNIMLVSVSERTRELGLRRALGARRKHIVGQVLAETLALTVMAGGAGIVLANGIAAWLGTLPLLGPLFEETSGKGDIRMQVSGETAVLAGVILVLVGLLSGLLPAVRAARLDPCEALRYE